MNIDEKLIALNIVPITNEIYLEHLKDIQLIGKDVSKHKYYKMYGDTPMFYREEYLNNNTLDELMEQDKNNMRTFCPSLISRIHMNIMMKVVGILFRIGVFK